MKVPMKNILLKVKGEGVFTEDQLIIFANPKDIPMLKKEGVYKGKRFDDGDKLAAKKDAPGNGAISLSVPSTAPKEETKKASPR
jgi:hypothetical protein